VLALLGLALAVTILLGRVVGARVTTTTEFLLSTLVWCAAIVVSLVTLLSLSAALTAYNLLASAWLAALLARLWRGASWPQLAMRFPPPDPASALIALPALLFALAAIAAILGGPEVGHDNLAYHLPRLGYWLQQQAALPLLANNPRIGSFPAVSNILQLVPVLFLRSDRWCGLIQLTAALGTWLAIAGVARALGSSRAAAGTAALLWLSIPLVIEQATDTQVDVSAAFFVVTALYFSARDRAEPSRFRLATAAAAALLAIGTKTQTVVFALPILIWLTWRLWRRDHGILPLAGGLAAVFAFLAFAAFQVLNWRLWGAPSGLRSVASVVVDPGWASLAKNIAKIGAPLTFWFWSTPPFAGILDAMTSPGLGLLWVGAVTAALCLLSWRLVTRRSGGWRRDEVGLAALGVSGALLLLFVMRHQPSIDRFFLPATASLTPLVAVALDRLAARRARFALLLFLVVPASALLFQGSVKSWRERRSGGEPLAEADRYGAGLAPIAHSLDALFAGGGARVGLVTSQYFPVGMFFGSRYQNTVQDFSYEPALLARALSAGALDAVWVEAGSGCQLQLFRRDFTPPKPRRQSWRVTEFRTFDADFLNDYGATVYYLDTVPIIRDLVAAGWSVVAASPRGTLFGRGGGKPVPAVDPCVADAFATRVWREQDRDLEVRAATTTALDLLPALGSSQDLFQVLVAPEVQTGRGAVAIRRGLLGQQLFGEPVLHEEGVETQRLNAHQAVAARL
jgi:hypothetical protein